MEEEEEEEEDFSPRCSVGGFNTTAPLRLSACKTASLREGPWRAWVAKIPILARTFPSFPT